MSIKSEAGEHHQMAELLLRGYEAQKAAACTESLDAVILAAEDRYGSHVSIQGKTDFGKGYWTMQPKAVDIVDHNLFYILTIVDKKLLWQDYIIPSNVVALAMVESNKRHSEWLLGKSKSGKQHKDSNVRELKPEYIENIEQYRGAYYLLKH